jgi:hypothetical protein
MFNFGRCLVVCTVGDREPMIRSLFGETRRTRRFDIEVINYGSRQWFAGERRWPGFKWQNIARLLDELELDLDAWDYFWFPDDDNAISFGDCERLFELADRFSLALCQPSLSSESTEIGWDVCRHVPGSILRHTNFVEIMCPLFRRDALEKCRQTFTLNLSGWGLDFLWPRLLDGEAIGVVDAVQVRHTGTNGSPNWRLPNGKTARAELDETLASWGIDYETCRGRVGNF